MVNSIPDIFLKRRSIRSYTPQVVEEEKLNTILEGIMYSPSARHTRAWEFIIVKDWEKIQKLGSMKIHAEHVKNSQVVIVVCSKEFKNWVEDASIIGAYIYLLVTYLGLATCWTQILNSMTMDNQSGEDFVKNILGIPNEIRVLSMFPIGYAKEEIPGHTVNEFQKEKLHFEKW